MQSIFTNENVFNYSDPAPNWIFDVQFLRSVGEGETSINYDPLQGVIPISISLPKYQTETVTKKYFGSEKTFPVLRTYGNDVSMKFNIYCERNNVKQLEYITQLGALRDMKERGLIDTTYKDKTDNKYKTFMGLLTQLKDNEIIDFHPELEEHPGKRSVDWISKFDTVIVNVKSKTGKTLQRIIYRNCVLTNFSYDSELDYESENKLQCTLEFHSDIWKLDDLRYEDINDVTIENDKNATKNKIKFLDELDKADSM